MGPDLAQVPVMLFIIFTLLMLQWQSFSRAMLVFLTGPLGIAGVPAAPLIFNRPVGFVALLGVVALTGMMMRNSVILIDQIEQHRACGLATWHAIVEAAVRRPRSRPCLRARIAGLPDLRQTTLQARTKKPARPQTRQTRAGGEIGRRTRFRS